MSTQEERQRWAADATHLGGDHGHRILLLLEDIEELEAKLAYAVGLNRDLTQRLAAK